MVFLFDAQPGLAQTPRPAGETRVLLVGAGAYPKLPPNNQLLAPVNDVAQMRDLFRRRGVDDRNIRILRDGQASERRADRDLPTHDNIRREIAALVDWARTRRGGDTVILYLSGHGSRQPDTTEADARAEVFLPRDVDRAPGDGLAIANAIPLKEIGEAAQAISANGTRVWVILDSCFSGTGLRSTETAAVKYVDPAVLGVKDGDSADKPIDRSFERKQSTEGQQSTRSVAIGPMVQEREDVRVYFYSSQAHETSRELDVGKPAVRRSAFTHAIATVLRSAPDVTFDVLFAEVKREMRGGNLPGVTQTPGFDGQGMKTPVPGAREADSPDQFIVNNQDIEAGQLQGLDEGSVIALFEKIEARDDQAIGHGLIMRAGANEATYDVIDLKTCKRAEAGWSCRGTGDSSPAKRAKVARLLRPSMTQVLRVSPPVEAGGDAARMDQAARIVAALGAAEGPAAGKVVLAETGYDLQWLVTADGFRFVPAGLDPAVSDTGPVVTMDASLSDEERVNRTVRALLRSHLVFSLRRAVAAGSRTGAVRSARIDLSMTIRPGNYDRTARACAAPAADAPVEEGRVPLCGGVTVSLTNSGSRPQYATLLAISERWNIVDLTQACGWKTGTGALLQPGESRDCVLAAYRPLAGAATGSVPPFMQHVVVAMTRAHVDGASPPVYAGLRRFNDATGPTRAADLGVDVTGAMLDESAGTRSASAGSPTVVQMLDWTVDRR